MIIAKIVVTVCIELASDMIAVTDFAAGAMENWGLIIYRESAMLYDPIVNLASNKRSVATIVAHELAHMVMHLPSHYSVLSEWGWYILQNCNQ